MAIEPRNKARQNILGMDCAGGDIQTDAGPGRAGAGPHGGAAWARGRGAEPPGHALRKLIP